MKQLSVLVPPELREQLSALAQRERRSIGSAARVLLEEALAARERDPKSEPSQRARA